MYWSKTKLKRRKKTFPAAQKSKSVVDANGTVHLKMPLQDEQDRHAYGGSSIVP